MYRIEISACRSELTYSCIAIHRGKLEPRWNQTDRTHRTDRRPDARGHFRWTADNAVLESQIPSSYPPVVRPAPSRPASPTELLSSATHVGAFAHARHRATNRTCASGRAPGDHQTVPRTRLWSALGWAPEGRLLTSSPSRDQSREGPAGSVDPRPGDPGCPGSGSEVGRVGLGKARRT